MEDLLFYVLGLICIVVVGKILLLPLKLIWKLFWNGIMGGALLLVCNYLGAGLGIYISISPLSAILAGFMGLPGVALLVIYNLMG